MQMSSITPCSLASTHRRAAAGQRPATPRPAQSRTASARAISTIRKQRRHSTRSRSLRIAPSKRAGDGLGVTARGSRNTASHHDGIVSTCSERYLLPDRPTS
jgi:hypothetical protein